MNILGKFPIGGAWSIRVLALGFGMLLYSCASPSKILIAPEEGPITPPSQTPPNLEERLEESTASSSEGVDPDPMAAPSGLAPETSDGEVSSGLGDSQVYRNPQAPAPDEEAEGETPLPEHAKVKVP